MGNYDQYKKINNTFFEKLITNSNDDHSAVGQSSLSHKKRFDTMLKVGHLQDSTLLDIGCGLGSFYDFLNQCQLNTTYTGFDISEKMIQKAKKQHPQIAERFILKDILEDKVDSNFDYIVSVGPLNLFLDEKTNYDITLNLMEKMFKHANKGFAFSMTSALSRKKNNDTFYYDAKMIISHLEKYCNNYRLDHSYLPHDFTIFGYKDDFYNSENKK
ncbi:MAG: class I SAM-dependent methyltransferase [Sphingobacteriaceae bacterium]|nr:class I SAM-dependent methyltransferase [Sphingobacteriaceae bacterium]